MKPIEKVSVTDAVIHNLKELILGGTLKIGDKLMSENEICSKLNVSRSTVREALRVLQAMGFVEIKAGRGAFVAKTSETDQNEIIKWVKEHEIQFTDFMEVRMAIEPVAVKLAIMRATDKDIEELEKILVSFEDAIAKKDLVKMMTFDELFHNQICISTHNNLLVSINNQVLDVFAQYRSKSFAVEEIYKNALVPHRKIMKAIKERDLEGGVSSMEEHLKITIDDMKKITKKN